MSKTDNRFFSNNNNKNTNKNKNHNKTGIKVKRADLNNILAEVAFEQPGYFFFNDFHQFKPNFKQFESQQVIWKKSTKMRL